MIKSLTTKLSVRCAFLFCLVFAVGCASWGKKNVDETPLVGSHSEGRLPTSASKDEEVEKSFLSAMRPKHILNNSLNLVGLGHDEKIARATFDQANQLFQQGKYRAAEKLFHKAARRFPDSALEEDSYLMMAKCQFFQDKYAKAIGTYDDLLSKYDNSRHLDLISKRRFAIADYWGKLYSQSHRFSLNPNFFDAKTPMFDLGGHSQALFEDVLESDSTGPLADDAVMQVANSYFRRGRYLDAAEYYGMLRSQYPKSDHQYYAHLLGLQAELRSYQGPQYDSTPLDNAEKLAQQTLAQFPSESQEERERVVQASRMIRAQKALRDWETAEYYNNGGYYASAKRLYQGIAQEYPSTEIAQQADIRLAELEGKPYAAPTVLERAQTLVALLTPQGSSDSDNASADSTTDSKPASDAPTTPAPDAKLY